MPAAARDLRRAWHANIGYVSTNAELRDKIVESDVLEAMGRLSLAAAGAEMAFAQALQYLLTDDRVDADHSAGKIAKELRSMDLLSRLLRLAMPDPQPLAQIFNDARRGEASVDGKMTVPGLIAGALENRWVKRLLEVTASATAATYLDRVKALYDKRNECMHAFELELVDGVPHLHKPSDAGLAVIDPSHLMQPCILLRQDGVMVDEAMMLLSSELALASSCAVHVATGVRWFRQLNARRAAYGDQLRRLGHSDDAEIERLVESSITLELDGSVRRSGR